MKRDAWFFAVMMLMLALPFAAQAQQPDNRTVTATPIIEGDPDPTPADRITVEMLKQKLDDGEKLLILDSRGKAGSNKSVNKIRGARQIAFDQLEKELSAGSLKSVPKTSLIVAYCDCADEAISARLVQKLMAKGFKNAKALIGGLAAWERAGFAVEPVDSPGAESGKDKNKKSAANK